MLLMESVSGTESFLSHSIHSDRREYEQGRLETAAHSPYV